MNCIFYSKYPMVWVADIEIGLDFKKCNKEVVVYFKEYYFCHYLDGLYW